MKMPPERSLLTQISAYINHQYPDYVVMYPGSSSNVVIGNHSYPGTDMVVFNPTTNGVLGIDIKGGSEPLPYGVYPLWKGLSNAYKSNHADFVAVTSSSLTEVFSTNVAASGINVVENAQTSQIVLNAIGPKLSALSNVPKPNTP